MLSSFIKIRSRRARRYSEMPETHPKGCVLNHIKLHSRGYPLLGGSTVTQRILSKNLRCDRLAYPSRAGGGNRRCGGGSGGSKEAGRVKSRGVVDPAGCVNLGLLCGGSGRNGSMSVVTDPKQPGAMSDPRYT